MRCRICRRRGNETVKSSLFPVPSPHHKTYSAAPIYFAARKRVLTIVAVAIVICTNSSQTPVGAHAPGVNLSAKSRGDRGIRGSYRRIEISLRYSRSPTSLLKPWLSRINWILQVGDLPDVDKDCGLSWHGCDQNPDKFSFNGSGLPIPSNGILLVALISLFLASVNVTTFIPKSCLLNCTSIV
jgi:hypothetical protein